MRRRYSKAARVRGLALRYARTAMDMRNVLTDQHENQTLRHLIQFGMRLLRAAERHAETQDKHRG